MNKYVARKRENLRLVLKPAERRRENKAVVVALEIAAHAAVAGVVVILKTQALAADEFTPLHRS